MNMIFFLNRITQRINYRLKRYIFVILRIDIFRALAKYTNLLELDDFCLALGLQYFRAHLRLYYDREILI